MKRRGHGNFCQTWPSQLWNSGTPELRNSGIWEVASKWKNTVLKWKAKSDSKFQVPEAGFQLVMIQYIRSESDLTRGKFQVPSPKAFENGIWNLAVSLARRFNVTDETGETDETGKFQTTKPHPISTPKFQVPALGSAGIWSAMATSRGRSCGLEFRGSRINFHISSQERVKFSALKFRTEGFRGTWNHTAQLELQEELPSLNFRLWGALEHFITGPKSGVPGGQVPVGRQD